MVQFAVRAPDTRDTNELIVIRVARGNCQLHPKRPEHKWVTPGVIYLLRADYRVYTQALTRPKSCPKDGDRPRSPFLSIGSQRVPSAGGIQNIDGSWPRLATEPCVSVCEWLERLSIGPGNRSIEEEYCVQVLVRDNNVDQALKVLKKKMQREGVFREIKLRGH
jgi:hypothetical protein